MPRKKQTKQTKGAATTMRPAAPALYSPERYEEKWRLSRYFNPTVETLRVENKKRFKVLINDHSLYN